MSILFFSSSLTHSIPIIPIIITFCLKNRGTSLQNYKRLYLQLCHNFFIMPSASFYFIIIFSLFFLISFFLLSNWNSNSWRLSFIIWIFFSSSPIVPSTCVQPLYAWIHACHVFYLTSRALICRLWQISYHHQLQH